MNQTSLQRWLLRLTPLSMVRQSAEGKNPFLKAAAVVPFFYYFLFYQTVSRLSSWGDIFPRELFLPIWPVAWTRFFDYGEAMAIIGVFALLSVLLAALFPDRRIFRFLGFLGVIEFHAFMSSFGAVHHGWLHWIWISFLFILLPNQWKKKEEEVEAREKFLLIFWVSQAYILLTYTLAGAAKVWNAVSQASLGEVHAFAPLAAALQVADWLIRTGDESLLGPFIITNPYFGWVFFVGIIYLQAFSLFAAYRPSLHRLWGTGLILSHVGIYLAMNIVNIEAIFLLALLLLSSPFSPSQISLIGVGRDLPIFGWLFRLPRLIRV